MKILHYEDTPEGGCLTTMCMWGVVILFAMLCALFFGGCDSRLKKENERLREELAKAQQYQPLQRDTIRDSIEVVTQKVVTVEKIKNVLTQEDRQLLKDIDVKVKELESLQKTGMVTRDTVYLTEQRDSILRYHDAWADFEYWEKERRLNYAVRDSLAIAVKREYKHRFLWWRWGVKGYQVKAVNFNPHSTLKYNTTVRRGE
jgi:hypothetical protein